MSKKPKKLPSSITSYNFRPPLKRRTSMDDPEQSEGSRSGTRDILSGTIKKLIVALKEKGQTLALAESCSGGYASYLLTKIPGASEVFKGAVVVYSLDTKNKFFNIPSSLLEKTQGVSKEVALKLATRVRKKFNSDIGSSIVGFAGPRVKKGIKVGTIFIAYSSKNKQKTKRIVIKGSRDIVRKKASTHLIDLVYKAYVED